ncbi:MAG: helix-turn-helix transcriptional regulator [Caldilineaceae bacterium]
MNTPKDIKDLIEDYLRQEGHSQAYFAKKLGYNPDRLNKWLLGVNKIPFEAVCRICCTLHLNKRQQLQIFTLAGYPFPKWVEDMLTMVEANEITSPKEEMVCEPSIMGQYEGESQEYQAVGERNMPIPGTENIERFSIDTVQGWVQIIGRSFHKTTKKRVSTWHGRLWKVENRNILYFAIELDTDNRELCTLIITCQNDEAEGWFYSGRAYRRFIYEFWAQKVHSFTPFTIA